MSLLLLIRRSRVARNAAEAKLHAIDELLKQNGCDCFCDHHPEDHEETCERCLACKIEYVMRPELWRGPKP